MHGSSPEVVAVAMSELGSCDEHTGEDSRLSPAMTSAFDRSIDAVLREASSGDVEILHRMAHGQDVDSQPIHPVLIALAEAWTPFADGPCLTLEQASDVHRDALLYVAACEMSQLLEWQDQGEVLFKALAAMGYPEVVATDLYAPILYVERLLRWRRAQLVG